jgi:antirestriction protein ArdC
MSDQSNPSRADVYARITAEIIAAIEKGAGEFRAPWHHDGSAVFRPANVVSGKPYRGVNVLALWAASETRGYTTAQWGTYRQFAERGAQVRKDERASLVVFWKSSGANSSEDGTSDDGEREEGKRRFFARGYSVFNVAQVDGYEPEAPILLDEAERHARADAFIAALGVKIETGGEDAYYRPSTDTVHLPCFPRFRDAASFYGVMIHEICNIASVIGCDDETKGGRSAALRFSAMRLRRTGSFPA